MSFGLDGSEQTLEFPFRDEIAPGFTVELKNVKEPVEILDAGAVFTSQPVERKSSAHSRQLKTDSKARFTLM